MLRSWPGKLARWLIRGYPRRPAAVITTGVLAALTVAVALAGPGGSSGARGPAPGGRGQAAARLAAAGGLPDPVEVL